jgi:hypothetical protein
LETAKIKALTNSWVRALNIHMSTVADFRMARINLYPQQNKIF